MDWGILELITFRNEDGPSSVYRNIWGVESILSDSVMLSVGTQLV